MIAAPFTYDPRARLTVGAVPAARRWCAGRFLESTFVLVNAALPKPAFRRALTEALRTYPTAPARVSRT